MDFEKENANEWDRYDADADAARKAKGKEVIRIVPASANLNSHQKFSNGKRNQGAVERAPSFRRQWGLKKSLATNGISEQSSAWGSELSTRKHSTSVGNGPNGKLGMCTGDFELPVTYRDIIEKLKRSHRSNDLKHYGPIMDIGSRTRTFLRVDDLDDKHICIKAQTEGAVENARRELRSWLQTLNLSADPIKQMIEPVKPSIPQFRASRIQSMPSRARPEHEARYPRVRPDNDPSERLKKERLIEHRKEIESLRQEPVSDADYGHTGVFQWPSQEISPLILGTHAMSLDELRMHFQCKIYFDRDLSAFVVVAPDLLVVRDVLNHLMTVLRGCIAWKNSSSRLFLVDPPAQGAHISGTVVTMISACDKARPSRAANLGRIAPGKVEEIACLTNQQAHGSNEEDLAIWSRRTLFAMQWETLECLRQMADYHGRVQIRVLFGVFVFNRYQWSSKAPFQPADAFIETLKLSSTEGTLYRFDPGATIFERVAQAKSLLAPFDFRETMDKMRPIYMGRLGFRGIGGKDQTVYEFIAEPEFNSDDGLLSIEKRRWMARGDERGAFALQLFVTQLQRGMSWKLEITADRTRERLPGEAAQQAVKRIQLLKTPKPNQAKGESELMFDISGIPFEDFHQRTIWKYRLKKHTSYVFELVRIDHFDLERKKDAPNYTQPISTEWEASLYHEEWDESFSGNVKLKTGTRAEYDPSLNEFFPCSPGHSDPRRNAGFVELVELVRELVANLNGARPW